MLEALEDRTAPATHVWSGATSGLMSLDANWSSGGHPVNGENGAIILVFPNTATTFKVTDDIAGLNVDQIRFTGAASGYVISGATGGVTLNLTGAAANQPNIDDQVGSNTFSASNLTLALAASNQINVSTGSLEIASAISSNATSGLTKVGAGTLTLAGNSPSYLGTTTVSAGALVFDAVAGSSPVNLASSTTLTGSGTVGGITDAGGTVAPGDNPLSASGKGRLTSNGNVSFDGASTFSVQINGTTAGSTYEQLSVTGTATLGGAKLLT
jgi:autotransporter-associated beta strand protein